MISVALFDKLPAPFAATGLLLGVIANQLELSVEAREEWKSLMEELNGFKEEMSGGTGYVKLLAEMIATEKRKDGDAEAQALVAELQLETVKINELFRELLKDATGFFGSGAEMKKFLNAASHKKAAVDAKAGLVAYRSALDRKTKRYSEIQVSRLADVLIPLHFQEVHHQVFKNVWSSGNWTAEVAVTEFVARVAKDSTCSPDLLDRFKAHLLIQFPREKIDIVSLNAMTEHLDKLLNLEETVLRLTPEKITYASSLQHPAFRALWTRGEDEKVISSPAISLDVFYSVAVRQSVALKEDDIHAPLDLLMTRLRARQASGTITVSNLAVVSDGLDPNLTLRGSIVAVLERMEAELPTPPVPTPPPPHSPPRTDPVTPTKSTAHRPPEGTPDSDIRYLGLEATPFVPMPGTPERGVCPRCGKTLAYTGKGTPQTPYSPGKVMLKHQC
jgi:hypothetical protein